MSLLLGTLLSTSALPLRVFNILLSHPKESNVPLIPSYLGLLLVNVVMKPSEVDS